MDYSDLQPAGLTADTIEDIAEDIAGRFAFDPQATDVSGLVRAIGGHVEFLDDPDYKQLESGSIEIRAPQDFTIYLSPFTGCLRDNFTIGHELGHYFLHSREGEIAVKLPRWGSNLVEREANRFAAALLMPRSAFRSVADRTGCDIAVLAGRFRVSRKAAQFRLKSLGYPSE